MSESEADTEEQAKEFNRKCRELTENLQDLCNLYSEGVVAFAMLNCAGFVSSNVDRELAIAVLDFARKMAQGGTQEGSER